MYTFLASNLKLEPALFEKLTLRLLERMGYGGSGTVTKISSDGGIDVIISEDKLGLRNIFIYKPKDMRSKEVSAGRRYKALLVQSLTRTERAYL